MTAMARLSRRPGSWVAWWAATLGLFSVGAGPVPLAAGAPAKPLKVLCSFYPMYVMALNVTRGVPGVWVRCMTESATGCLHDYQLTPGDLKAISGADVFIANGGGMESFLDKALAQAPKLRLLKVSEGIPQAFDGNPHVWLSVAGAIQETRNLAEGLASADPVNAAQYRTNAAQYTTRLEGLSQEIRTALEGVKHREIITFHEAFPYFAAEFKLKIAAVIEREPGSEPSAGELAKTITQVRQTGVKAVFAEPQYPVRSAEVIHRETGVPVRTLDPCVTGPRDPAQARESYLVAMRQNLKVLLEALRD